VGVRESILINISEVQKLFKTNQKNFEPQNNKFGYINFWDIISGLNVRWTKKRLLHLISFGLI
jgi:hypothetical protein